MPDTLIVNARLVNEGREFDGDLRISRGRIDAIGHGLSARAGETVVDAAGRLRVLYDGKNYEPFAVEVPPTMGTMFAFLRADNSWHGHEPFEGERRVVQVAWLKDASELERKKKRNRTAQFLKGIFGR